MFSPPPPLVLTWQAQLTGRVRRRSPHAPQHLKEDQMLSIQKWDDDEEDGHQKAEEEHHGLDYHACTRKIRAAGIPSIKL